MDLSLSCHTDDTRTFPHVDPAQFAVKCPTSGSDGVVIDLCAHFRQPIAEALPYDLTPAELKQAAEWQAYLRDARERGE